MSTPILKNWSCSNDPWKAPEQPGYLIIQGEVHGSHKFENGSQIKLGAVTKVEGRLITTENSQYILEEPLPLYCEWLKENRPNWDPENPITLKVPL